MFVPGQLPATERQSATLVLFNHRPLCSLIDMQGYSIEPELQVLIPYPRHTLPSGTLSSPLPPPQQDNESLWILYEGPGLDGHVQV
jgi:hypothetical protein